MKKDIVVGSLVVDERNQTPGVVIKSGVTWVDTDGQTHMWDFEVLFENESVFADYDELTLVQV